jgi:hypothetical protein
MTYIAATSEYGIVIRKAAMKAKSIDDPVLFEIMTDVGVLGDDKNIVSFGPLFGKEALDQITTQLGNAGLTYVDDFCTFDFLMPEWLSLGVRAT